MSLLRSLVDSAKDTIESGYYRPSGSIKDAPSLVAAVERGRKQHGIALIAEIKPATPIRGKLVEGGLDALMGQFLAEGASALSVLTEPKHFHGSLANLKLGVRTGAATLMKDFILSEEQIDCAAHFGASAILLIAGVLPRSRVGPLIEYAHLAEREVLLEVATPEEYAMAMSSDADLVGINNRDLKTFSVDLGRTPAVVKAAPKEKPVVSLSGFETRAQVQAVQGLVDAVLVGSSLIEGRTTVRELIGA